MKKIRLILLCLIFFAVSCADGDRSVKVAGHHFVDLALPSGTLWAATNVGAKVEADAGDYFAWGETAPKSAYSWETYSLAAGEWRMLKYCAPDAFEALAAEDDAASALWGSECRMPTHADFAELRDTLNCIWNWTSRTDSDGDDVSGYLVTSVRNGNSIFLPAAGCRDESGYFNRGKMGYYWSSVRNPLYSDCAFYLAIESYFPYTSFDSRFYGLNIRAVLKKAKTAVPQD